jgi:DNA-binding transcriptional ArsR family regulator
MVQPKPPERVVVRPLWTEAVFAQLSDAERAAIEAALRQFSVAGDYTALKVLADASPHLPDSTLYEMRIEAGLRVLLLHQKQTQRYEVVGINRHAA